MKQQFVYPKPCHPAAKMLAQLLQGKPYILFRPQEYEEGYQSLLDLIEVLRNEYGWPIYECENETTVSKSWRMIEVTFTMDEELIKNSQPYSELYIAKIEICISKRCKCAIKCAKLSE